MFRLIVRYFSRWFHTDKFADFFPVSVKGLLLDQGKVLLLKNEREEWDFPGGKILEHGQVKATLVREFLEETNLNIEIRELMAADLYSVVESKVFVTIFQVSLMDSNALRISKEHMAYNFFSLEEVDKIKTAQWVPQVIEEFKKNTNNNK
jgi:8-oxo-dGTP pyrophosphatase MutT (NUDIX family)